MLIIFQFFLYLFKVFLESHLDHIWFKGIDFSMNFLSFEKIFGNKFYNSIIFSFNQLLSNKSITML